MTSADARVVRSARDFCWLPAASMFTPEVQETPETTLLWLPTLQVGNDRRAQLG